MKVLVTGGAGYIGSHAVRELRDAGHDVAVLDDLSHGHREAVPDGVPLVEGDLADPVALRRALEGASAVIHFAGLLSVAASVHDPGSYYRVNVGKGVALLEAMKAAGVGRIVFSSTCAVYGIPLRVPIDEDHPLDPINPYGATKRAFERALFDFAAAGVLRAVALRYFNAAGCHPDGSLGKTTIRRSTSSRWRSTPRSAAVPGSSSTATTTTRPTAPASATTSTCRTSPARMWPR